MAKPRRTKKSESIEVGLSHPLKVAFMERCREHGRSASDVIRAFIDDYLADPPSKSLEYQKMLFKAFKPAAA